MQSHLIDGSNKINSQLLLLLLKSRTHQCIHTLTHSQLHRSVSHHMVVSLLHKVYCVILILNLVNVCKWVVVCIFQFSVQKERKKKKKSGWIIFSSHLFNFFFCFNIPISFSFHPISLRQCLVLWRVCNWNHSLMEFITAEE